jgi:hypothetical protein
MYPSQKMTTNERQTYVVFFSNNFDKPDSRRLALLRRYVEAGSNTDVKVLGDAVFIVRQKYSCLMIVDAPDRATLDSALASAGDAFHIEVQEASLCGAPDSGNFQYCVVAYRTDDSAAKSVKADVNQTAQAGAVRVCVKLADDSPYAGICLVDAPTAQGARLLAANHFASARIVALPVMPVSKFFQKAFSAKATEESVETLAVDAGGPAPTPAAASTYTIVNQGKNTVYVADASPDELDYRGLYYKRQEIAPGATLALAGTGYVWSSEAQVILNYTHEWGQSIGNDPNQHHANCAIKFPFSTPGMSLSSAPGTTIGFDLDNPGSISVISPLNTWLNDLMNTTKFNEPWEEDLYQQNDPDAYKAYQYILSQIPGDNVPKDGTIKPSLILNVDFPTNVALSKDAFDRVKKHLVDECTFFEYTYDWFSPVGVFGILNQLVFTVQTQALIDAANEMGSENTTLEMALDAIIDGFLAVIAMVPGIGEGVAGAMEVILAVVSADTRKETLRAAVSDMSHVLTDYIQKSIDALATQHRTLNSNWGTLKTFAIAAIDGDKGPVGLTPGLFGIDDTTGRPSQGGTLTPPPEVVEAASKTWTIAIYKALFSAVGDGRREISIIASDPIYRTTTWTADVWQYRTFRYSVPGSWTDNSGNPQPGYFIFECSSGAPDEVISDLFGRLGVNPIEYFMGLNGWPGQTYSLAGLGDPESGACPIQVIV